MKNRLRGHFPASPVTYGVGDGIVELSLDIRKSAQGDVLEVSLRPDAKAAEFVGFSIAKDGKVQVQSNAGDPVVASSPALSKDAWQRLTLRLDFKTGKAALLTGKGDGAPAAEFSFDANKRYRAVVLSAAGDADTTTQVADLRLTQSIQ
jgi:hypothetical protein